MNFELYTLNKTLVFVGMMGCGKSTVAKGVAKRLGVAFADTDTEIERSESMTITEIFAEYGEDRFREAETAAIKKWIQGSPRCLSVGGGAYLNDTNRNIIERNAVSIWLKADIDVLWTRVRGKSTRPLLQSVNPYCTLARLAAEREPYYEKAQLCVHSDNRVSPARTIERVLQTLQQTLPNLMILKSKD